MTTTTSNDGRHRSGIIYAVTALFLAPLIFAIGLLVGATTQEPERIETVKTVTEKVEVPTTPIECIEALEYADEGFSYMSDAFDHIADEDYSKLDDTTDELVKIAPYYTQSKLACRDTGAATTL